MTFRFHRIGVGCVAFAACVSCGWAAEDATRPAKVRKFTFLYGATISGLSPGKKARVWVPLATSGHEQKVQLGEVKVPATYTVTTERKHGNKVLYFEAAAGAKGDIPIDVAFHVERRELLLRNSEPATRRIHPDFLAASRLIPVDGSLVRKLLGGRRPSGSDMEIARLLYDAVDARLRYDKPEGKPWGRGDAAWACDSRYGNCTDFHSLFIGACRDLSVPARFEMGFPIPEEVGSGEVAGYHCWAKFLDADGKRWVAVDISEADKNPKMKEYYFGNLTADRLTFTIGRDLELEPAPKSGPVNFLVYPYVEVDGRPHATLVKRFAYRDVE